MIQIYGQQLLQNVEESQVDRRKLAVCVRPVFGPASDVMELIQVTGPLPSILKVGRWLYKK
jgi:hypothetical protein